MKTRLTRWLVVLAVISLLIIPGCNGATEDESQTSDSSSAEAAETTTTDETETAADNIEEVSATETEEETATETTEEETTADAAALAIIELPEPSLEGDVSLEETLAERRSVRSYADSPLTLSEISQLLWAAQGITDDEGKRTAPSAQATYPLELYLIVGNVDDLEPGIYHYEPEGHQLELVVEGDSGESLIPYDGAAAIVITADFQMAIDNFGEGKERFVYMEAGHVAQNVYLQATALGLGTVSTAGFDEEEVISTIGLSEDMGAIYIMPVGWPAD